MKINTKIKHVFITGGTGSVGIALVAAFCSDNYKVTFQYTSNKKMAMKLEKESGAQALQMDFSKDVELPNAEFDVIINNAGINITSAPSHKISIKDWEKTLAVNLNMPFLIIKKYLPLMRKRKFGRIINISSIWGLRGADDNLPYTVSKHGMSGLTKTVAKENASFGITCNEICPGAIDSELINGMAIGNQKRTGQSVNDYFKEIKDEIPAGRLAKPEEIANLAVFLASEKAGYLNGASIQLDGALIC